MRLSLPLGRLVVTVTVLLAGCTASDPSSTAQTSPQPVRSGCGSTVDKGPLPEWARAGFSGDSSMPHVMGDRGDIVAAMFSFPLTVSRSDEQSNKILWVPKELASTGDLVIEAKLDGSAISATRRVPGGPGPSIIDFPQPGCWQLTLTWPGHTDTMELVYH